MKRGFTLVELLAVIVILAIIALIAVPLVGGIIEDSKQETTLRSAENYVKAIELDKTKKQFDQNFKPTTCEVNENGNLVCERYEGELVIKADGDKPTAGTIIFDEYSEVSFVKNLKFDDYIVSTDTNKNNILSILTIED